MGLSPEHHKQLNSWQVWRDDPGIYDRMRVLYAGDAVALQQIDVYDGSTEYSAKIRQYGDAIKSGDVDAERRLEAWFKEHYPDI